MTLEVAQIESASFGFRSGEKFSDNVVRELLESKRKHRANRVPFTILEDLETILIEYRESLLEIILTFQSTGLARQSFRKD